MLSDVIGLVVALVAVSVATRPATDRSTFGFQRAEVFGAVVNGVILLVVAVSVGASALVRLLGPGHVEVQSVPMLVVAVVGLVANVVAALILRSHAAASINMRGAYLEVLGDLLGSIAAIVAAVVILSTGFVQADSLASLAIALLIAPRALLLLRDAIRVLSESAPVHTSVAEIRTHILGTAGVVDVHDVHVWAITSGNPVFSATWSSNRPSSQAGEPAGCWMLCRSASRRISTSPIPPSSWSRPSTPSTRATSTSSRGQLPSSSTSRAMFSATSNAAVIEAATVVTSGSPTRPAPGASR